VAEAELVNVNVEGSLFVMADCPMGRVEDAIAVNYDTQLRSRIDLQVHHVSGHRTLYALESFSYTLLCHFYPFLRGGIAGWL
jgi:hypothetical protein